MLRMHTSTKLIINLSAYSCRLLIGFTEDKNEPDWRGYLYAVLLFIAAVFQSVLAHQYFHGCFRVGMRIRSAVIASVYGKVHEKHKLFIHILDLII